MTETKDFHFASSTGRDEIFAREWVPFGAPRAVLQIAHGVDEHILRYDGFARFLNADGILVVGNDHLGHGRSARGEDERNWFAEKDGWDRVVDDMRALYEAERAKYPDAPYFLLGHSMGSFLARTYIIRHPGGLDGVILSGTNQMPAPVRAAALVIAGREIRKNGAKSRSERLNALGFGAYNKRFEPARTASDWLSRDEAEVDRHNADPLCNRGLSSGLFRDMLGGLGFIAKKENLAKMDKSVPVLFAAGDMDPVGRNGRGVRQAYESFRRAGCQDVSLRLYKGARHEILNETNRDEVYGDILKWLEERMKK